MVGSRVLVVEDEPGMLDILRVNLEHAGFEVIVAQDGVEAWQQLDLRGSDVLVLDLNLPRMSGFRLLNLLRRDPNWGRIPTVVVTSFDFEEVQEVSEAGVESFLKKPFNPAELVDRVQYVLCRKGSLHVQA